MLKQIAHCSLITAFLFALSSATPVKAFILDRDKFELSEKENWVIGKAASAINYSTSEILLSGGFKRTAYDRSGSIVEYGEESFSAAEIESLFNSREDIQQAQCSSLYKAPHVREPELQAISCEEYFSAALCHAYSHEQLQEKAQLYCERYSELSEKTINSLKSFGVTYSDDGYRVDPYLDAVSFRCRYDFSISYFDREQTLDFCLDAYRVLKEESKTSPVASVFLNKISDLFDRILFIYHDTNKDPEAIETARSFIRYLNKHDFGDASFGDGKQSDDAIRKALQSLGDAYYRNENYTDAIHNYQRAIDSSPYTTILEESYPLKYKLAITTFHSGDASKAKELLRAYIREIEINGPDDFRYNDSTATRVQENNRGMYDALQYILIDEGEYAEALEISDRRKSFIFSGKFQEQYERKDDTSWQGSRTATTIQNIKDEAKRHNATFIVYSKSSFPITSDGSSNQDHFEENLNVWLVKPDGDLAFRNIPIESAIGSSLVQSSDAARWAQLARGLAVASCVLLAILFFKATSNSQRKAYVAGLSVSLLVIPTSFIVVSGSSQTRSGQADFSLLSQVISQTSLQTRGTEYSDAFERDICYQPGKCLKLMYDLLIRPVETELPPPNKGNSIIVIPDEELNGVSFSALQSSKGSYLIDDYVISTAPSITALRLLRLREENRTIAASDHTVVGHPIMPTYKEYYWSQEESTLEQLPFTRVEADGIASLLGVEPLLDEEATEQNVLDRLTFSKYIHIATHGLASGDNAYIRPAFALTPASDESRGGTGDGLLDTDELYGIPFNGELAVLSACDTSYGNLTLEGHLSLARPFLTNGIPSVVASLWPVNDQSTADLMLAFYQNLGSTESKAVALREAILTTKEKYPNPSKWAGFMLIGLQSLPATEGVAERVEAVGRTTCSPKYYGSAQNTNARSLTKATLRKISSGFELELTVEDGSVNTFQFNSEKDMVSGYGTTKERPEPLPWKVLEDEGSRIVELDKDGRFNIIYISRHTFCTFEGKLEFEDPALANFF